MMHQVEPPDRTVASAMSAERCDATASAGRAGGFPRAALIVDASRGVSTSQPFVVGLPIPKGVLAEPATITLRGPGEEAVVTQASALARWSDGSVKWLLLDGVSGPLEAGRSVWGLDFDAVEPAGPPTSVRVREAPDRFEVDTGPARLVVGRRGRFDLSGVEVDGRRILEGGSAGVVLTDERGRRRNARIESAVLEDRGPVRATVRLEGRFEGWDTCRFVARICAFSGTGLVRLRLTVHNPRRARHPGGIWDLGDPGAFLFRDLSLELSLEAGQARPIAYTVEDTPPFRFADSGRLEIFQGSSGGENWRSSNHVNSRGEVPITLRGYRVRDGHREEQGLRASPVVAVGGGSGTVAAAVPEFWQQFPKAITVSGRTLRLGLFPREFGDPFELQGGEQKTQELWLHFGPPGEPSPGPLEWVHRPARVRAEPVWYAASGALPRLPPAGEGRDGRLIALMAEAVDERAGLAARREIIDEYGWRNFGEVYADHEEEFYDGTRPAISHYNNQYDMVLGFLLHYLGTGDARWFDLADPLARHVADIDIYHTVRDRPAYSGGMFWFTDHYKGAGTSTHRTYSRTNCPHGDRSYGGGPSSNHLFSTGLLHHYYLTGDLVSRDAVVELADWVVRMDDGRRTILGLVDPGPTGLASVTGTPDYHGPGRGPGNSINTLIDGWLATGRREYLDIAEALIRRVVHPGDDIAARDLLNVEKRWSYAVFFSTLARYLDLKAEAGELDQAYAYAQASLVAYARWMLDHERPYFDRREELEYPTEAWPAQELRKANVLKLAAEHVDEPLRPRFVRRGDELADRAWDDLMGLERRASARAVAIVMVEGLLDAAFRAGPPRSAPRPLAGGGDFGHPRAFVPQKQRVAARLQTPRGLLATLVGLADVRRWRVPVAEAIRRVLAADRPPR